MLQLAQTDGDHIAGALDEIELRADGKLHPVRSSIIGGTFDGDQLTLAVQGQGNMAGTMKWRTIQLSAVGSGGTALSWDFERSSVAEFKAYADELKANADRLEFTASLLKVAQELRQTVHTAEAWISSAELHARKIPEVEDYYQKLEEEMRSLVARERTTNNSVARAQLSVAVSQGDVAGTQADVQVRQTWDITIIDVGRNLSSRFLTYPSDCDIRAQLRKRVTQQGVEAWGNACHEALAERTKLASAFRQAMKQRAELRDFQVAAQAHRRRLVDDSRQIQ